MKPSFRERAKAQELTKFKANLPDLYKKQYGSKTPEQLAKEKHGTSTLIQKGPTEQEIEARLNDIHHDLGDEYGWDVKFSSSDLLDNYADEYRDSSGDWQTVVAIAKKVIGEGMIRRPKNSKNKKNLRTLAEHTLRQHIRRQLLETYFTPGTRSAEYAEDMRLNEFHGILEQVNQYAKEYGKSSFDVLDELMAIVEGESKTSGKLLNFQVGDKVKLTWVNENVSREDVIVAGVGNGTLHLQVEGDEDSHKFTKVDDHWIAEGEENANDPVVIENSTDYDSGGYDYWHSHGQPNPEELAQIVVSSGHALLEPHLSALNALQQGNTGDNDSAYDTMYDWAKKRGLVEGKKKRKTLKESFEDDVTREWLKKAAKELTLLSPVMSALGQVSSFSNDPEAQEFARNMENRVFALSKEIKNWLSSRK